MQVDRGTAGQCAETLDARLGNIDVYRLMHLTLFGRLLDDPAMTGAVAR